MRKVRIPVEITAVDSAEFPGFVSASLTDAFGVVHTFRDKVPVFTEEDVEEETLPVAGWLGGVLVECFEDGDRTLARIDTARPWGIESVEGETRFVVPASSLLER